MQTKHYIWLAAAIGIIIGVIGWLIFVSKTAVAPASSTASTTITDLGNGVKIQTTGDVTITPVNDRTNAPKPPAVVALSVSADIPADVKAALETQYASYAAKIKTAPTRVDLWLQLGVVYKIAGQYSATASAWTYVAQSGSSPSNYVAYGDLGDLYLNFTHEYAKAEASYKAALALNPGNADFTAGLKAAQQAQGK